MGWQRAPWVEPFPGRVPISFLLLRFRSGHDRSWITPLCLSLIVSSGSLALGHLLGHPPDRCETMTILPVSCECLFTIILSQTPSALFAMASLPRRL